MRRDLLTYWAAILILAGAAACVVVIQRVAR